MRKIEYIYSNTLFLNKTHILTKVVFFTICIQTPHLMAQAPTFGARVDQGEIEHNRIDEASGIVASLKNIDVFWTHNDSGDRSRIYAFNANGEHLGVYDIAGAAAIDWEDMAIGPGPVNDFEYIYIGDIGDFDAVRGPEQIYRIIEPEVNADQTPVDSMILGVETINFRYPDGPRDAETLLVDPLTKDVLIVTKLEDSVRVYRAPFPQSVTDTLTLDLLTILPFTLAVGGDISRDGQEILIKTYTKVFYWKRQQNEPIAEVLKTAPIEISSYVTEPQGEAICWAADASGFYTLSEEFFDIPAHLYFYPRNDTTPVEHTENTPHTFHLEQNYPNPFNPSTTFAFSIPFSGQVKINIYNINGAFIRKIHDGLMQPGKHTIAWQAISTASGVYFYELRLIRNGSIPLVQRRKLVIVK